MKRVGIMGGTFDPIHSGHLEAASAAESALKLTSLLVIPSNVPPHRPPPLASSYHRFAMVSLAVAELMAASSLIFDRFFGGEEGITTNRAKAPLLLGLEFTRDRQVYYLIAFWVFVAAVAMYAFSRTPIGRMANAVRDNPERAEFVGYSQGRVDYPAILGYAHFAVVARPGHPIADVPQRLPALASRMVRPPLESSRRDPLIVLLDAPTSDVSSTAIRERRAKGESVSGLVPDLVRQHIEQHELYSSPAAQRLAGDSTSAAAAGRLHGKE